MIVLVELVEAQEQSYDSGLLYNHCPSKISLVSKAIELPSCYEHPLRIN